VAPLPARIEGGTDRRGGELGAAGGTTIFELHFLHLIVVVRPAKRVANNASGMRSV
jgi:hypothetical protein